MCTYSETLVDSDLMALRGAIVGSASAVFGITSAIVGMFQGNRSYSVIVWTVDRLETDGSAGG